MRGDDADPDLRLCRFFGLSNGYWLRAQAAYDTEVAEEVLSKTLQKIKPWHGIGAPLGHTASSHALSSLSPSWIVGVRAEV